MHALCEGSHIMIGEDTMNHTRELYQEFLKAVEAGSLNRAKSVVEQALWRGIDPAEIYFELFRPAMVEIGNLWQLGLASVAQERLASFITGHLMAELSSSFEPEQPVPDPPLALLACVGEERHDLGLRMVADTFRRDGWEILNLGICVPAEAVVDLARDRKPALVALSATLSSSVEAVKEVIRQLREDECDVTIAVGGFPFNAVAGLWRRVGADLYSADPRFVLCAANHTVVERSRILVAA